MTSSNRLSTEMDDLSDAKTEGKPDDEWVMGAYINPLVLFSLEDPHPGGNSVPELDASQILADLCSPDLRPKGTEPSELAKRCAEVTKESARLFAVPQEKGVFQKLIWPLRQAKVAYVLGNYVGTIALCGMVAE